MGFSRRDSDTVSLSSQYFGSDTRIIRNKVNFVWNIREDYREGRRRGVLLRGRTAQVIAQESVEEHIRGSVERLDNQFSTLHQDVATLSCEVFYTGPLSQSGSETCEIIFYTYPAIGTFSILRDFPALSKSLRTRVRSE